MVLTVDNLTAGYGQSQVLFDVSLAAGAGEVLALPGRNGMGKTTTVSAVTGLLPAWSGALAFEGKPIANLPSLRIARRALGLVPEGRQIFPTPIVEENSPPPPAEIRAVLAALKNDGQTILVIDKNLSAVLRLARRIVMPEKGRLLWAGTSAALRPAVRVRDRYPHL